MDRIAHLALGSRDVVKTTNFYKEVFGIVEAERYVGQSGTDEGRIPYRVEAGDIPPPDKIAHQTYNSDGYMNLTVQSSLRLGMAHIGVVVDDLDKTLERLEGCQANSKGSSTNMPAGVAAWRAQPHSKTHKGIIWDLEGVVIDVAKPGFGLGTGWPRRTRAGVTGKLELIVWGAPDLEKSATFYQEVFGLDEVDRQQEPVDRVSLSDGHMNLTIGKFGVDGLYAFGFRVDDLEETIARLEAAGAERISSGGQGLDVQYKGPQDVIIAVSERGWTH